MVKDYEIKGGKYIIEDVVSCFDVDSNIRMKPVAFMNIAQEMATRAADPLGFGYNEMLKKDMAWVLSRMHFVFLDTPLWNDEIVVSTWHKGIGGPFFLRDLSLSDRNGQVKVIGTSSWVVLDLSKRSMVRLSDFIDMIPEGTKIEILFTSSSGKVQKSEAEVKARIVSKGIEIVSVQNIKTKKNDNIE